VLDRLLQGGPWAPAFGKDCPAVWVLDAGSLNLASLGEDAILVPGGPRSAEYLPVELQSRMTVNNAMPIAIMPPRASPRIVAQHGMFTVHGHETTPLEELARVHPEIKLGRVRLDLSRVARLLSELRVSGVHRLSVVPDLDSVAAHVCWIYQSTT
jgi:hypothetical protein